MSSLGLSWWHYSYIEKGGRKARRLEEEKEKWKSRRKEEKVGERKGGRERGSLREIFSPS